MINSPLKSIKEYSFTNQWSLLNINTSDCTLEVLASRPALTCAHMHEPGLVQCCLFSTTLDVTCLEQDVEPGNFQPDNPVAENANDDKEPSSEDKGAAPMQVESTPTPGSEEKQPASTNEPFGSVSISPDQVTSLHPVQEHTSLHPRTGLHECSSEIYVE